MFTVKYGLRLKKELSIEHIIQHLKTRWEHSYRRTKHLICFKNEEMTMKEALEQHLNTVAALLVLAQG